MSSLAEAVSPGGGRRLGVKRATQIQSLAKETVAPPEPDEQMALQVRLLIQQFDLLEKQIEIAEQRVAMLLDL